MAGFSSAGSSGGFAPQAPRWNDGFSPEPTKREDATSERIEPRPAQANSGYRPWWLPSDIAYFTSSARDLATLGYTEQAVRCAAKVEDLKRKLAAWEAEHGKLEAA